MVRTVDIRLSTSAVVLRVLTLRVLLTLEYNIVRTQQIFRPMLLLGDGYNLSRGSGSSHVSQTWKLSTRWFCPSFAVGEE